MADLTGMAGLFAIGAAAELAIAGIVVVRLALGPSVCDRVVALNAITAQIALAMLFWAVVADRSIYLDLTIWMVSFGYLGALVWSRLLEREQL